MAGEFTDHGVLGDADGGATILILEGDVAACVVCLSAVFQVRFGAVEQARGQLLVTVSGAR